MQIIRKERRTFSIHWPFLELWRNIIKAWMSVNGSTFKLVLANRRTFPRRLYYWNEILFQDQKSKMKIKDFLINKNHVGTLRWVSHGTMAVVTRQPQFNDLTQVRIVRSRVIIIGSGVYWFHNVFCYQKWLYPILLTLNYIQLNTWAPSGKSLTKHN